MLKGFERTILKGRGMIFGSIIILILGIVFKFKQDFSKGWFALINFITVAISLYICGKILIKQGKKEREEYKEYLILKRKEYFSKYK